MSAVPNPKQHTPYRLPVVRSSRPSRLGAQSANEPEVRAPIADEPADRRFWTAYDHFMVEREARELRNAYIGAVVKRGWRWLKAHVEFSRSPPLVSAASTAETPVSPRA